jgi:hypothetical protein
MKEALAAFLADAPARNIQAHVEGLDLAGVAVSAH